LYEHLVTLRLQLRRGVFDAADIELEPGLRNRNVVGPGMRAEAGLCSLRERPQRKGPGAAQSLGVQIPSGFLLEGYFHDVAVEPAAPDGFARDRAEAGDE